MLPVNSGGHTAYQNFVSENLRKYYPNPDAIARSTWDIIERFWTLDLTLLLSSDFITIRLLSYPALHINFGLYQISSFCHY